VHALQGCDEVGHNQEAGHPREDCAGQPQTDSHRGSSPELQDNA
jgi:hypothetical protein